MKKFFSILLILVIAGCSKKESIYKDDLNGTWVVYKYLLYNVDKTPTFLSSHPGYAITFTSGGTYTMQLVNPDTTNMGGTYHFTDNDQKIALDYTTTTFTLDSVGDTILHTHSFEDQYTIFNLTKDHVILRNDTSQLYMNKP